MTVVEVIPLVASTAPVIVGGGIVGAVVGILGLLVESTGLGVLNERLGVEVGSLLSVEDSAHSASKFIENSGLMMSGIVMETYERRQETTKIRSYEPYPSCLARQCKSFL